MKISLRWTTTLALVLVLLLSACNRSLAGKGTVGNTNEQAKATLTARAAKGQPAGTTAAQTAAAVLTQAASGAAPTIGAQVTVPPAIETQPPAAVTPAAPVVPPTTPVQPVTPQQTQPPAPSGENVYTFTIPAGQTAASTGGALPGNKKIEYRIAADKDQMLIISVASPANNVMLGVTNETDNSQLQAPNAGKYFFVGRAPAAGNYRLTVVAPKSGSAFTLEVIKPLPIQINAATGAQNISAQAAGGQTYYYAVSNQGGQTVTVRVGSANNTVHLSVYNLTTGKFTENVTNWDSGPATQNQDYLIFVISTGATTNYTLEVTAGS